MKELEQGIDPAPFFGLLANPSGGNIRKRPKP
jgi:hypothetical protein